MSYPFSENKKLTVINFLGGPCVGKSVQAAQTFVDMKCTGFKVELIHEYAKELVWEQRNNMFTEQDYITANQNRMLRRLIGHDIDYAVCDTSLLLGALYMPWDFPDYFRSYLLALYDTYDNINILLVRNPDIQYQEAGRNQNLEEARKKDQQLLDLLHRNTLPYHSVMVGMPDTQTQIMDVIKNHKKLIVFE